MSDEDRIRHDALSEEDLSFIANNEKYVQLLKELLPDADASVSADPSGRSFDSTPRSGLFVPEADHPGRSKPSEESTQRGADPTSVRRNSTSRPVYNPDQVVRGRHTQAEDDSSSGQDDPPAPKRPRLNNEGASSSGQDDPPAPKRPRLDNEGASSSETYLFDPVMAGTEEDECHFTPPEVVNDYLERHFRRSLSKKERTAMLKRDPKPSTLANTPPEVDPYILTFWKNKIDLTADNQLKQLQTALLYTAGPLAGLWSQIVDQGLNKDPEALIQVPIVLETLQRALVLLGNVNSLFCEKCRSRILESIDPNLSKYARGGFPDAENHLFGPKFQKEIVSQVEADTALTKAAGIISRTSTDRGRKYPQNRASKPRGTLFRSGRMASYGGASSRPTFNPYGQRSRSFRGRGRYQSPRVPSSVFSQLGSTAPSHTQSHLEDFQTSYKQK